MPKPKHLFLSDHETSVDLLYYEAIARTVVGFVRQSPELPLTIGIHGDWGAGKSSILKMVSGALEKEEGVLCIWFNGWTFEGFDDAKTVVIETLVTELRRARPTSTKVADAAKKVLRRIDWLKVAQKAGGLALTAATGIPSPDLISHFVGAVKAFAAKPAEHIHPDDAKGLLENASGFLKAAEADHDGVPEQVHKFREEYQALLDAADIKQLVVLIDDLDRCLPETAISTLEAIRLFLHVPKTAFVVAADEAMIEYSVRRHFPELPIPAAGMTSYARSYLEKLIQVPFRVPALGLAETRAYITLLLAEAGLPDGDETFGKLLQAAREDLRRPWQSSGLERKTVHKALGGQIPDAVDEALKVSEQIARQLADGTRGNPRQIKRFLNSLMLRKAISTERGFGDDIQTPVLAKVMLAERFIPDLYDQVARLTSASANGHVTLLAQLEGGSQTGQTEPEADSWTKSDAAKDWAALKPPLASVDLRPYVFVARDKRTFFTGVPTGDHLESLTERLTGSSIAVRQAEAELVKLGVADAEQLFDAVSDRILAAENLAKAPSGVEGLAVLVTKQPALQRRLLEFLRKLPTDKVGAWAATGWGNCFAEASAAQQFGAIREEWAASASGPLKAAAAAARNVKTKKS
jgi:predicted KAP-like P-loop ATPase